MIYRKWFAVMFLVVALIGGILIPNAINANEAGAYTCDVLPVSGSESGSFVMDISSGIAMHISEEISALVFENPENEEESVPIDEGTEDDEMYDSYIAVKDYCEILIEQLIAQ